MPGPLLHVGFTVSCSHGGQAIPMAPNPRVTVMGQPTMTVGSPAYSVAGCPLSGSSPCVTATWYAGATRVSSFGLPLAISTGASAATPTASPLIAMTSQLVRVLVT